MGNVHASETQPNLNFIEAPPVEGVKPNSQESEEKKFVSFPNNPGSVEELHRKCKEVFPMNFEGGKLMVNVGLSRYFQVTHTLSFANSPPTGYKFGATYVGSNQVSPNEAYPVLMGDIDPSGNVNANMIHQFSPRFKGKFVSQIIDNRMVGSQGSIDFRGNNFSTSLALVNFDPINLNGIGLLHYLQRITPNLALGLECVHQRMPQIPGGAASMVSVVGRYATKDYTLSGSIGPGNFHACYYQKANEHLQVGVEVETNTRMQESTASLGYQIDLPKADLVFKGMVDNNFVVGATFEKQLKPLPLTFILSGMIHHPKSMYNFGLGLHIG